MSTPGGVEHDQGGVDASQLSIEGSVLDKYCFLTLAISSMIDILQALIKVWMRDERLKSIITSQLFKIRGVYFLTNIKNT